MAGRASAKILMCRIRHLQVTKIDSLNLRQGEHTYPIYHMQKQKYLGRESISEDLVKPENICMSDNNSKRLKQGEHTSSFMLKHKTLKQEEHQQRSLWDSEQCEY